MAMLIFFLKDVNVVLNATVKYFSSSSEDEIDIILHGTPEQRRKLQLHRRRQSQGAEVRQDLEPGSQNADSSSEDEFEKEMNAELTQQVKVLEDSRGKNNHTTAKTETFMRL